MTFKADVLAAAKLKAEELEDWKFVSKRYQSRPVKFCDLIIDPFWFFYGSPAAAMIQPAVGVYIKEVEVIVSDLSGLPVGKIATFPKRFIGKSWGILWNLPSMLKILAVSKRQWNKFFIIWVA
ncbi:hypothetical protein [uncultured Microbulbifer sp.]|uniref:hypothetical protein n=1 Tax=uncultured Microbulbifer sp. TaxID=348147 RepID=UPI00260B6FB0|nr:hypothetical protein [uncultured Microbulbifer sp.]